ncbi:hypothetical protein pb186bvf_004324 [Paramecium bursaria]
MLHKSVIIYSKVNWKERLSPFICPCPLLPCPVCLQPCEEENEYSIIYCDEDWTNWGQIYFEVKEESSFIQRMLCPPSRRQLTLVDQKKYSEVHLKVEKPFKCSILCFQRPEMLVHYREQYIGKIIENIQYGLLKCEFYSLTCHDKNNSLLYEIRASCCQCGLVCMLPCKDCSEIQFDIKDRKKNLVGKICHLFGGFRREWCTKADTYGINFPEISTVEEKTLLIIATLFIDYSQFQNF